MAEAKCKLGGVFTFEHYRDGKKIDEWKSGNIVTNEGLDHLLDVTLHNDTQKTTWYVGIFKGNYTPVAGDTAANVATNTTEATEYDETTRVEWVEAAASSQSITNSANKAVFNINASVTIYGAFLTSFNTKGADGTSSDKLMAASKFSASRALVNGDDLYVTYTLSAADA